MPSDDKMTPTKPTVRGAGPAPRVEINGQVLSDGQVMTMRVALENFAMELVTEMGPADYRMMNQAYMERIGEIRRIMRVAQ